MKENTHFLPMKPEEKVWGWGYFAIQLLLLPTLFTTVNGVLTQPLPEEALNFLFFSLNFTVVAIVFHRFLGFSLLHGLCHPFSFLFWGTAALAGFLAVEYGLDFGLSYLVPGFQNPNDAALTQLTASNRTLMAVGTILLVPVAEELFYRGLMFRGLYFHSEYGAWILSVACFSIIHVLPYFGSADPVTLILAFCQYIPAGILLCWCYQRSGTILTPIAVHGLINAMAVWNIRPFEIIRELI